MKILPHLNEGVRNRVHTLVKAYEADTGDL